MDITEQKRPRLLTVGELAELLAVPRSWVYSHAAAGDLPCVRVGRYLRFNAGQVLHWCQTADAR